jgi:hypothetical protein
MRLSQGWWEDLPLKAQAKQRLGFWDLDGGMAQEQSFKQTAACDPGLGMVFFSGEE